MIIELNCLEKVAGKEHFDDPVTQDAEFALCSWELAEIDPTPQNPGKEAGEAYPVDFSARCLIPNDAQEPKRVKMKGLERAMMDTGVNIVGQPLCLAQGTLSRR